MKDDSEEFGKAKSFVEHLDDLRKTLICCLVFIAVGIVIAIPLSPLILDAIKRPLAASGQDPSTFLRVLDVTGGISIAMRISLWGGVLIASPFIAWAIAWFVFPALSAVERKIIIFGFISSLSLFIAGAALCYFATIPVALRFMFRVNQLMRIDCSFIDVADYSSFVLTLMMAFGLAFQFPMIMLALGSFGILDSGSLSAKRRHAIVLIFIIAMVLTPPDVASQILMAIPLMLLYELSIILLRARERIKET